MIDWLSLLVPLRHRDPICGGHVRVIEPDGTFFETLRWTEARGSHDSRVSVRSHAPTYESGSYHHLYISGNPSKFFQGHNLDGTESPGLVEDFARAVLSSLNLSPDSGFILCNRIDVARCYHVGTDSDVDVWLEAAEQRATMRHRGRGALDRGTLYYGKQSRRWSLKGYNKGREVKRKGRMNLEGELRTKALEWAEGKLRLEATYRRLELEAMGLRETWLWQTDVCAELYDRALNSIGLDMKTRLDASDLRALNARQRGIYSMWLSGIRLDQVYSRSTYYRHRAFFASLGVDLSSEPPKPGDVIPLLRPLVARAASSPPLPMYQPVSAMR